MSATREGREPAGGYRRLAAAQLGSVAGLDGAQSEIIEGWVEAGDLARVARGTVICRRGDPCAGLLLVAEGAVAVGRNLGQGDAQVLTYLGPGDVYGFIPLLDDGPQLNDLMAHEASVLLVVPAALVQATLARHAAVREAFAAQIAHRSRIVYDRLFDEVRLPLQSRLARQLDFLGKFFGATRPQGVQIGIRVSQTDLAQALGASRQQVNAELRKFEERGLISVSRARVVVHDPEALAASGYSNPPLTLTTRPRGAVLPSRATRLPPPASAGGALQGVRVLLVEDDSLSRLLLAAQLHQAGARVDEAENGAVAVDKVIAAAPPYDVIVMDEHMPQLSGVQATRRIREHQAVRGLPATPILGVSSDAGRDDTKRFIAAGMNAHLAKPFRRDELLIALRCLLG